ncbi:ABC transporter ATP-binding protein [Sphingobacterium yanglingense]|uniref:ABC-2 type transport system ATP-binding protein n=1 Tax=Sphingobacterium yanglingense TaxID=1437280 RepID=A0A4R6WDR7_9SPHI|nr:ABC transporter ATP-binding protein [Sphingobacterium yanglingense]TDQ77919.1 ABC-2 type transport system ATP-binding protein [Sphingobacterium yanglingense]
MATIISVEGLSHKYNNSWAIQDISFEINKTGILGLLGSNGAGKSTTMNIMCGVLNQTKGDVIINGIDLKRQPEQAKKEIGFLPQQAPLYKDLTVDEYLFHCAYLRQIASSQVRAAVEEAKERCGLSHFSSRLIKNLSGGYQQRVGIAQAIIHKPLLVVLDEPTNGLDPNQIIEVRSLIKEIAEDRAVIFSSHILSEVQQLCKDIRMIDQGRLVFADTMDAFNSMAGHILRVEIDRPPAKEELLKIEGVMQVDFLTERSIRIHFDGDRDVTDRIIKSSVKHDWCLREIYMDKSSLDEVFAQLSNYKKAK